MKPLILFDFDGTLANSLPIVLSAFKSSFIDMNLEYPGDEIMKKEIGKHLQDIFGKFLPEEKIEEGIAIYRSHYIPMQRSGKIEMFDATVPALEILKEKKIRTGIVTTKLRSFTQELIEQVHIDHFFEFVVGAEDVKKCKPDPEPLFLAVEKAKVSVDDAVYVGDSLHDAEAAKAAGMEFFGVETGGATKKELEEFGEVFTDVLEFAQKKIRG